MSNVSLIDGHIDEPNKCTECKHFVSCEFGKQAFHEITETPCVEFESSLSLEDAK
jgi:hypothetical protein